MFDSANPATWAARDARNESGTLLCICGEPGQEFFIDGVEVKGDKKYGILRGACCDEHWAAYRANPIPEEFDPMACFAEEDPAPAPVTGFGPLFAGLA